VSFVTVFYSLRQTWRLPAGYTTRIYYKIVNRFHTHSASSRS